MLKSKIKKIALCMLASCFLFATAMLVACGSEAILSFKTSAMTIVVGESQTIEATLKNSDKSLIWTSSDENVATVDHTGTVTAKAVGKAEITATVEKSDVSATCKVTVPFVTVREIKIKESVYYVTEGQSLDIGYSVLPAIATDKTVAWSSSDESVATVDQAGKVTAVAGKAGAEVIITATYVVKATDTAPEATLTDTCKVIVCPPVSSVNIGSESYDVNINETVLLDYSMEPANAVKDVTFSSSDPSVAKVDANGKVYGLKEGSAVITITSLSGGKTDSCKINVRYVKVEEIVLDRTSCEVVMESTDQLIATVKPRSATEKEVEWTSSDESILKVDKTGVLVPVKDSQTAVKVTVKAKSDSTKFAECLVTVKPLTVEKVEFKQTLLVIKVGDVTKPVDTRATVAPSNATYKDLIYTSSNEGVATVNDKGVVTGIAAGETIIKALNSHSGKFAEYKLVVGAPVENISINGLADKDLYTITHHDNKVLSVSFTPSNASVKDVVWQSSDNSVFTVIDNDGEWHIIAHKPNGEATLTATSADGGKVATCTVKVLPLLVNSITVTPETAEINEGESKKLTGEILPANASDTSATWTSSNPEIVTVDGEGNVTAIKAGVATVSLTANDGSGKTDSCEIVVVSQVRIFASATYQAKTLDFENIASVKSVTIDSDTMTLDNDYAYAENTVSLKYSAILAKLSGSKRTVTLNIVDNDDNPITTKIEVISGTTDFESGEPVVIYGERNGISSVMVSEDRAVSGERSLKVALEEHGSSDVKQTIAISRDYLKMLLSEPNAKLISIAYNKNFKGQILYTGFGSSLGLTEKSVDFEFVAQWQRIFVSAELVDKLIAEDKDFIIGVMSSTHASIEDACIYIDDINVISESEATNAITFENGMSDFVTVLGATAEVVDSSVMGGNYATVNAYSNGNNEKVLKITIPANTWIDIRVSTQYIKLRLEELGYDYEGATGLGQFWMYYGIVARINAVYADSPASVAAGNAGLIVDLPGTVQNDYKYDVYNWNNTSASWRHMFKLDDYYNTDVLDTTYVQPMEEYWHFRFSASTATVFYMDDICAGVASNTQSSNNFQSSIVK